MAFLEVHHLWFKYEDQWIVNDVSFQGDKGELIAIVGPSGCGKTTLLRLIVGILVPQEGVITLDQKDITQELIEKRMIGYVPQNQALFPHLDVFENIAFGLKAQNWEKSEVNNRVKELSSFGGLLKLLNRKPHELSGGQQQRVALLRALAPSPKLLLLDEPLSNIDTQLREQLAMYIRTIQQISDITTLFVTHDLNEAKMLADKIIIIDQGKIMEIGSPMSISVKPRSIEVARSLGLKNLFEIKSITRQEEKDCVVISTEIGQFKIDEDEFKNQKFGARGLYIDPTILKISKEAISSSNSLSGEIIAIIPEPTIKVSTLLLNISPQVSKSMKKENFLNSSQIKILRVQVPLEKTEFQISERLNVKIPIKALKLYT